MCDVIFSCAQCLDIAISANTPRFCTEICLCDVKTLNSPVTTYTGVLISSEPNQKGKKLQRPNSKFCKPLKKKIQKLVRPQVLAVAMTSAQDEKWRPFNCFFSRVGLGTYQHPCIVYQVHSRRREDVKVLNPDIHLVVHFWTKLCDSARNTDQI